MLSIVGLLAAPLGARAATYYVRQTMGDDGHDGTSPASAWQHVGKLSAALHAGDTAYVGPGLYREEIDILNDGSAENRLILVADPTGQYTGDPPGTVMLAGSDPIDETTFAPFTSPGVFSVATEAVLGVVEMDGRQLRYGRADQSREHVLDKRPPLEALATLPATYFYDEARHTLFIHTSDGKPPATHEIELMHRGNGVAISGKHFVTVMGFTFRHMGDAGVCFWKGSGDGVAIDNIAWGSRQGIRVYGATNIAAYRNTLFRNENSGIYFAAQAVNGWAIGNIAYENVKGLRWSSGSQNALVLDNTLFDNREAGVALENTDHALLRRNTLQGNARYQLFVIKSEYGSEDNCFETEGDGQLTADFLFTEHYRTLVDYQHARRQDLHSRAGGCGRLPPKIDVGKLHAETTAYTERARKILREGGGPSASAGAAAPP